MRNKLLLIFITVFIVAGFVFFKMDNTSPQAQFNDPTTLALNEPSVDEKTVDTLKLSGGLPLSDEKTGIASFIEKKIPDSKQANQTLTDEHLVDFAIEKITEVDIGIRPDRYSIEQLAIIGKYIKGMPLTREELEINLTYFLDVALRVENENPEGPVGGIDFEGKKEWVDAHAYNEGFKYWNSLVEDGDAQAARLLGRYYATAGYTNDAISTYKYILPHLKTQKDKGYITYQLANELKEKDPFIAAVYYWLSISDFNSNLTNGKLQNILEQYDARQLQEQIDAIKLSANWHTTDD